MLARSIRYDTEQDINYRYSIGVKASPDPELESRGINYHLVDRWKTPVQFGMPALAGSNGDRHVSNFEQMQRYSTVILGTHSHGGARGMEGLHTNFVCKAHDRFPMYSTLGACAIGTIQDPQNLCYTLLRFQGIGVSGGTGSVTNYGGDFAHAAKLKRNKGDYLMRGQSIGQAHWGSYGAIYHRTKVIPMTGAKINLYGDPTLVPLRNGPRPTYPFLARPVHGFFRVARSAQALQSQYDQVLLENNQDAVTEIRLSSDSEWLQIAKPSVRLQPGESNPWPFASTHRDTTCCDRSTTKPD